MKSPRTAAVALLSFSSGLPLGLVWIAIPGLDAGYRCRHPHRGALHTGPSSLDFQGPLVATDGSLCASVDGTTAWLGGHCPGGAFGFDVDVGRSGQSSGQSVDCRRSGAGDRLCLCYPGHRHRRLCRGCASEGRAGCRGRCAHRRLSGRHVRGRGDEHNACRDVLLASGECFLALCYMPMLFITWRAPEPETEQVAPKSLKTAVWYPFLGFLVSSSGTGNSCFCFLL